MALRTITNSLLSTYRTCQRLYFYKYDQLYRPVAEAEPLHTGNLGHAGLEAWWLAAKDGKTPDERLEAALVAIANEPDPYEYARMIVLLTGYTERWGAEEYEVLGVEVQFKIPVVNPDTDAPSRTWEHGGKVDVAVRKDGRTLVMDHKLTGADTSPGSSYCQILKVDSQISTYYAGVKALYGDVHGWIHDVIGKPTLKPYKATPADKRKYKADGALYANQREVDETPEEYAARLTEAIIAEPNRYYVRLDVVRLDEEMRDAQFDVWQTAKSLRESELANRWPRNPNACARYGRACDFLPVCCREASLDDPALYRRAVAAHEELVQIGTGSNPKEEGVL